MMSTLNRSLHIATYIIVITYIKISSNLLNVAIYYNGKLQPIYRVGAVQSEISDLNARSDCSVRVFSGKCLHHT